MPLWQIDCDDFRRVGKPFELRNVTTSEHLDFVGAFSARFGLLVEIGQNVARFEPAGINQFACPVALKSLPLQEPWRDEGKPPIGIEPG